MKAVSERDETIGRNIARLRDEMSQKELADRMASRGWKWSQATVWSVEAGKRPVRFAEAVDVCWILGAELGALEGDEDDLKAHFFIGKYFQAIDDVRDALTKATTWQLQLANSADEQELSETSSEAVLRAIASDDVLDAFARMFVKIANERAANLRTAGMAAPGPHTSALVDAWLVEAARVKGATWRD